LFYELFTAMSPERPHNPITLDEIVSIAKEIMLRDGKHVPAVIIESGNKLVAGQIHYLPPTHGERVQLMHHLGQSTAKGGQVHQIQQVFMVHEGWMSVATDDKPVYISPSQDPNRVEVLIASVIQMPDRKKQSKVFEIIRDRFEQIAGFDEVFPDEKKKEEPVRLPLLEAFVDGFQIAFRSKFN
jgi:hypothetical protein